MQDEIQLLFLSFFIFMEMKKACAHLIRSYSSVKRKNKERKGDKHDQGNLTELYFPTRAIHAGPEQFVVVVVGSP